MIASSLAAIPLTIALIPVASIEEEGINCYNKGIWGKQVQERFVTNTIHEEYSMLNIFCICYYPIVTYTAFMSMDTRAKALS
jgi:hypothetical protein